MKKRAFTLIELLVVIAIIAILGGILFPVMARAREQARKATCQSNLKQIGSAFQMYRQDYDETMPVNEYPAPRLGLGAENCVTAVNRSMARGWIANPLMSYVRNTQLWACPSDVRIINNRNVFPDLVCGDPLQPGFRERVFKVSYAYNYLGVYNQPNNAGNALPGFTGKDSNCLRPSEQAIMWDSSNRWVDFNGGFWCDARNQCRDVVQFMNRNFNYGHWHAETANYLYMDGHVKNGRVDQMRYQNFFNVQEIDVRYDRLITARPFPI